MSNIRKSWVGVASAVALTVLLAACDSGVDVNINAPVLEAAGLNLKPKPKPEPDLAERSPLVLPPKDASLPTPGSGQQQQAASNNQQWPKDPVDQKKLAAQKAKDDKQKYCDSGDWKNNKSIEDFNKNTGVVDRCRPEWVQKVMDSHDEEKK